MKHSEQLDLPKMMIVKHYISIFFHRKHSISISTAEAGMFKSKEVNTSGCSTPSLPMTWPLTCTSAQRPGKNVESVCLCECVFWGGEWGRGGWVNMRYKNDWCFISSTVSSLDKVSTAILSERDLQQLYHPIQQAMNHLNNIMSRPHKRRKRHNLLGTLSKI